MKRIAALAFASLLTCFSADAASLDTQSFGASLNGWNKNRTASYTINNSAFRTHIPTVTGTTDGGIFISTRIDRGGGFGSAPATCFLELTFSPEGYLTVGQIRIKMKELFLNTGAVTRRADPVPAEGEEVVVYTSPTETLVQELFGRLDTELAKLNADEDAGKRDLFGRLSGSDESTANYAAALRHNLNLLLANVR